MSMSTVTHLLYRIYFNAITSSQSREREDDRANDGAEPTFSLARESARTAPHDRHLTRELLQAFVLSA